MAGHDLNWDVQFAVGIWGIWRWRNDALFQEEIQNTERKSWIMRQHYAEIVSAFSRRCLLKEEEQRMPQHGWNGDNRQCEAWEWRGWRGRPDQRRNWEMARWVLNSTWKMHNGGSRALGYVLWNSGSLEYGVEENKLNNFGN